MRPTGKDPHVIDIRINDKGIDPRQQIEVGSGRCLQFNRGFNVELASTPTFCEPGGEIK